MSCMGRALKLKCQCIFSIRYVEVKKCVVVLTWVCVPGLGAEWCDFACSFLALNSQDQAHFGFNVDVLKTTFQKRPYYFSKTLETISFQMCKSGEIFILI